MKRMNEQDKNRMLEKALNEGESYSVKVWGTIMASEETMISIGATGGIFSNFIGSIATGLVGAIGSLTNEYCYVGMTDSRLICCIVGKFNCSQIKGYFSIHFDGITKVKIKKNFIPGRTIIEIFVDKNSIKISFVNNTIGSDMQGQKEGVESIIKKLSAYKK